MHLSKSGIYIFLMLLTGVEEEGKEWETVKLSVQNRMAILFLFVTYQFLLVLIRIFGITKI
jgi:hypothetical protein